MDDRLRALARTCLAEAEGDARPFPDIVAALAAAGFEAYLVDLRHGRATYSLPDGDSVVLDTHRVVAPVAPRLDHAALQAAIREAQQAVPGYTYRGFCEKAARAGCAFYVVSFSGRRALYVGRDAATHVEPFPAPAD
ncbi:DUF1398 family protein [Zavarzinia sp. CC-PAN008]|uniref:DUF1398 family protein n=1 Tax=Zavarzinia sp. CC-PAN008 TaxID=3243332 RepID=UPI003F749EC5